ncbi:MAG: hypothetical protein R2784_19335, partial [Saprospiraceae bacterium]
LGKPNIQKMHVMVFQKMMKEAILQLDILYARAIAKGLALVTGKWSTKGHTDPQNNKLLERAGIIEVVLEKDEGEWKLKMVQNFDFTGMYNNPKAYAIKTLSPTV